MKYLFVFFLTYISAFSQVQYEYPLTEKEIIKLIPLLKEEINLISFKNNESDDIEITEDPLDLIKSSKYFSTPQNTLYDKDASIYISNLEKRPIAVFTYGIDASQYSKLMYNSNIQLEQSFLNKLYELDDNQYVNELIHEGQNYYLGNKFNNYIGFYSPDSTLKAELFESSYYHFLNYPDISTGPLILLSLVDYNSINKKNNSLEVEFDNKIKESGFTKVNYNNIKTAIRLAEMDSKNMIQFNRDAKLPSNNSEKKMYEELIRSDDLRKKNALLYLKYEKNLQPLLRKLD